MKGPEVCITPAISWAIVTATDSQASCFDWPLVMFLLARLILDTLMNQTNLEELEEELKPEILPSQLREA